MGRKVVITKDVINQWATLFVKANVLQSPSPPAGIPTDEWEKGVKQTREKMILLFTEFGWKVYKTTEFLTLDEYQTIKAGEQAKEFWEREGEVSTDILDSSTGELK